MRVCIEAQAAITQRAGVGRYTQNLVAHLREHAGADEVRVVYFDFKRRGSPPWDARVPARQIRWCPGRLAQGLWKRLNWPPYNWFAGPADVYHFPNFVLPPCTRGRGIVTIHDMSFVRYPEFAEERNLRYLNAKIRDTARRADAIITDSGFSADEIRELLPADASKVFPIHLGISDRFRPPPDADRRATLKALGLDRPYVLTVGTIEPRKNLPFLVECFERLTGFEGQLVLAGRPGWKCEPILARIRASKAAGRIRHLESVEDDALPALYSGAALFAVTSFYEGFGFPPLEAMACGTPVISSTGGSLAEVLGDGAELVAGFNADEWATRAQHLLEDGESRAALAERGRARAARYSWSETARRTWEVYRRVGGGR